MEGSEKILIFVRNNMNKKIKLLNALVMSCITAASMSSQTYAVVKRPFAGSNRFDTSLKIVSSGWTSTYNAVISAANDGNLVDALTAAPLAKKLNAPIFLTGGDSLDADSLAKIKALKIKTVYITSGTGVIGSGIETQLKSIGVTEIHRLGGADRYITSVNIARAVGNGRKIMLARGDEYADALSAAAVAAREGIPILLSKQDSVPDSVKEYISEKRIDEAYVLGLQGALSDTVASSLPNSKRLGGSNRYETNISIIKEFEDSIDFSKVYVASGESRNLVDALAGSPLAAKYSSPIILTSTELSDAAADYLSIVLNPDSEINVFGGEAAVPQSVSSRLTDIENSISNKKGSCVASIQNKDVSVLKQITVKSTDVQGCSKFRIEGSSSVIEVGNSITLIPAGSKLTIYLYSQSNEILAKGILDVSKPNDSQNVTVRLVR